MSAIERAKQLLNDPYASKEDMEAICRDLSAQQREIKELLPILQFAILVHIPGVPQLTGQARTEGAARLLAKIVGKDNSPAAPTSDQNLHGSDSPDTRNVPNSVPAGDEPQSD